MLFWKEHLWEAEWSGGRGAGQSSNFGLNFGFLGAAVCLLCTWAPGLQWGKEADIEGMLLLNYAPKDLTLNSCHLREKLLSGKDS